MQDYKPIRTKIYWGKTIEVVECVKGLIKSGTFVNVLEKICDKDIAEKIFSCCFLYPETFKDLTNYFDILFVDKKNINQALFHAVWLNYERNEKGWDELQCSSMEILLDMGFDPNTPVHFEDTIIQFFSRKGRVKCAELLLRKGADPEKVTESGWSEMEDFNFEDLELEFCRSKQCSSRKPLMSKNGFCTDCNRRKEFKCQQCDKLCVHEYGSHVDSKFYKTRCENCEKVLCRHCAISYFSKRWDCRIEKCFECFKKYIEGKSFYSELK